MYIYTCQPINILNKEFSIIVQLLYNKILVCKFIYNTVFKLKYLDKLYYTP